MFKTILNWFYNHPGLTNGIVGILFYTFVTLLGFKIKFGIFGCFILGVLIAILMEILVWRPYDKKRVKNESF